MKFLCCFRSCRASVSRNFKEEGTTLSPSMCPPEECTVLPVSATRRRTSRRKRWRRGRPGSYDWKPSLGPISEDHVFPTERVVAGMARQAEKKVKRNKYLSGGGSSVAENKVCNYGSSYHYHVYYGPGSMISFLSVFAATLFMF